MIDITHPELVAALVKPGADILATLDPKKVDLLHMVIGVTGEAGELVEWVERGALDRDNLIEELGDIEFYLEGVRQNLGIDRSEPDTSSFGPERPVSELVMAVMSRSAMLLDLTKKMVVYNKDVPRDEFILRLNWIELWLEQLRIETGMTRDECLAGNIAKLAVRYEGLSYSDAAAQNRADKAPGD